MTDQYDSFAKLESGKTRGVDYDIQVKAHDSPVAIIAPHGGEIEPHTTMIAAEIANNLYNFYSFLGLKPNHPHGDLHITSTRFDEPECLHLISACDIVVAIHGRADDDDPKTIFLGGLDVALRNAMATTLIQEGFSARAQNHRLPGTHQLNICNRGRRKCGVQLELPRSLRNSLNADRPRLGMLANAARTAIAQF